MENGRPGVMFYFNDLRPFTSYFTYEQLGMLLTAILAYGENCEWNDEDCDPDIRLAMMVLKPKIDRDRESYERKKLHGQYMAYVRLAKEKGETYLSEPDWIKTTVAMMQAQNRLAKQ